MIQMKFLIILNDNVNGCDFINSKDHQLNLLIGRSIYNDL